MTNREIMIEHCKKYTSGNIDDLQIRDDVLSGLTSDKPNEVLYLICSCPNNWGLSDFVGNCEEPLINMPFHNDSIGLLNMCKCCWEKALDESKQKENDDV